MNLSFTAYRCPATSPDVGSSLKATTPCGNSDPFHDAAYDSASSALSAAAVALCEAEAADNDALSAYFFASNILEFAELAELAELAANDDDSSAFLDAVLAYPAASFAELDALAAASTACSAYCLPVIYSVVDFILCSCTGLKSICTAIAPLDTILLFSSISTIGFISPASAVICFVTSK